MSDAPRYSLAAQIQAITIATENALAIGRSKGLRPDAVTLLRAQLHAAERTLRLLAEHEAEVRAALVAARHARTTEAEMARPPPS